jgi:hypothetical protein
LATLFPVGGAPPRFDPGLDLADIIVNFILFVPLGLVVARGEGRWTRAVLIAIAASGTIELLQGLVVPGRRGSPVDLSLNLLGALAGYYAFRGPWITAAVPLLAWLFTGPLLAPSPPETPVWWGQISHHFGGTEPFTGRILAARFLGRAVPDDALPETPDLVERARREGFVLEVDLIAGLPVETRAHLAGVSDGQGHTIISLEQAGSDLLLQWQSRAAGIGLRPARAVLPGAFAGAGPGDTVVVRAVVDAKAAHLESGFHRARTSRTVRLLPPEGWRSFYALPRPHTGSEHALTGVWSAAALIPALILFLRLRSAKRRRLSY